jgi:hypothetical protein
MLKFGTDESRIRGNIGVRWVTTDVFSTGGAQFPRYTDPGRPAAGSRWTRVTWPRQTTARS